MDLDTLQILNPLQSSTQFVNDQLHITTDCGYMWGMQNRCHNLCITHQAFEACTAELHLEILPQCNGEQAGLVLLIDADNYIKLVREMVEDKQVVVLALELDGEPEVKMIVDFDPADLVLKIEHNRLQITVFWKGKYEAEFKHQTFLNLFPSGAIYQPGLLVHGSNPNNQAIFKAFEVES